MENHTNLNGIRFATKRGNNYFYDNVTSMVFYCPNVMYEILKLFKTKSKDRIVEGLSTTFQKKEILRYYNLIEKWTKNYNCFFLKGYNTKSGVSEKEIKDFIQRQGFRQLILNVTENCNLKCSYCVYSSGAYPYFRPPSHTDMSFNIAKKAIDLYFGGF